MSPSKQGELAARHARRRPRRPARPTMLYNKDAKRFRQATMMGGGALRLDDEPAPKKPMSAAQMLAASTAAEQAAVEAGGRLGRVPRPCCSFKALG